MLRFSYACYSCSLCVVRLLVALVPCLRSLIIIIGFSNSVGDPPWSNNVGCFAVYANGVIIGNIALLLIVETSQLPIPRFQCLGLYSMFFRIALLVFMLWVGFKHDLLRSPGRLVQVLYTDGIGYYICVFRKSFRQCQEWICSIDRPRPLL